MPRNAKLNEAAIYLIAFVSMISVGVSPALALIAREYSWASTTQIQLVLINKTGRRSK